MPGAEDPRTHRYPNSPEGALAYLADDSDLNLAGATARPNPPASGVWLVRLPNEESLREEGLTNPAALVYLAGTPDPFGRVREHNDFETGEETR